MAQSTSVTPLKTVALLTAVVAAALVPLYGDPRLGPLTHAEWARMLVRAIDLENVLPARPHASFVFGILSWKSSLSFAADQYVAMQGLVPQVSGRPALLAERGPGEVSYRLAIVRPGDYRLRVRAAGTPLTPLAIDVMPVGSTTAVGAFPNVRPTAQAEWVDVGALHLDRGTYDANLQVPQGAAVERLEITPPCLNPIEPLGGWRALAPTTPAEVAETALQALNWEDRLPLADAPVEAKASDFQVMGGGAQRLAAASKGAEAESLSGGAKGLRAVLFVDLPVEGLYTISAFGVEGRGQRWMADACQKAVLCPPARAEGPGWRHVLTGRFQAGRHMFTVTLGPGASVERLKADRRREGTEDYVATLRQLGFDVGTDSPIPRKRAVEAMEFIHSQRRLALGLDRFCGDTIEAEVAVNMASGGAGQPDVVGPTNVPGGGPPVAPPAPPAPPVGPAPPPIGPPPIPPQPPASAVAP